MSTDDRIASPLPELLDCVFTASDLSTAVAAVTDWWRQQCPGQPLAVGVLDEGSLQLITSAGQIPIGALTLREMLTRQLGSPRAVHWRPFTRSDEVIGGVVLAVEDANAGDDSIPAVWVDVTARLLREARERHERFLNSKLAAMAEFAAGAGHEINNPLATIVGRTRELAGSEADPERRRVLSAIGAQAWRIRDMIGDTMLFARPPEPSLADVDLVPTLQAVLSRFEEEVAERGIEVTPLPSESVTVTADETQLAIVLSELLRNALRAISDGGRIEFALTRRRLHGESIAELTISDNGPGLTEKDREHLFDPFYSGREAGRGLGFGLSKCWRIVTQHGGTLRVGSLPQGTKFVVRWPEAKVEQATLPLRAMRNSG